MLRTRVCTPTTILYGLSSAPKFFLIPVPAQARAPSSPFQPRRASVTRRFFVGRIRRLSLKMNLTGSVLPFFFSSAPKFFALHGLFLLQQLQVSLQFFVGTGHHLVSLTQRGRTGVRAHSSATESGNCISPDGLSRGDRPKGRASADDGARGDDPPLMSDRFAICFCMDLADPSLYTMRRVALLRARRGVTRAPGRPRPLGQRIAHLY